MDHKPIPILDLSYEVESLWDQLQAAYAGVLRSTHFIMGPNVKEFEREVANYLGVKHAIGLNSGTDALVIALRALGVGPGDEVITSPFTFFATAEAISGVGATPVFVDVDPLTYNLDVSQIESAITSRSKAIIPVHLFGQPADMVSLMAVAERFGLGVVEDVAQAFGAEYRGRKVGTFGALGAFSFFPTKNLGAYGDGGLLATDDDHLAEVCRMLQAHGSRRKYYNEMVGYNSRLDEIQAAILRVKLPHITEWNEGRRRVAARYADRLGQIKGIVLPTEVHGATHVYHQYTIRLCQYDRERVQRKLEEAGIGTMVYYPVPAHRLPVYAAHAPSLPVAESLSRQVLSLPMWPQMPESTQERVIHTLTEVLGAVWREERAGG